MPRKRMVDPTIWSDPDFQRLSTAEQLLFIAHISYADDEARGAADAGDFKALVFPTKPDVDESDVERMMAELGKPKRRKKIPMVLYYDSPDGMLLYWVPRFSRHQVINKPTKSRLAPPPDDRYMSDPFSDAGSSAPGMVDHLFAFAKRGHWSKVERLMVSIPGGAIWDAVTAELRSRLDITGKRIRGVNGWLDVLHEHFPADDTDDVADEPVPTEPADPIVDVADWPGRTEIE